MEVSENLYKVVVSIVDQRMQEIKVTREDFDSLKSVVAELARAQKELAQAEKELARAQKQTETSVQKLAKAVGGLSDTVGYGLEDIAKLVLPGYLERHFKLYVHALTREHFKVPGGYIEFDLFGVGKRNGKEVVVLGECKSRITKTVFEKFLRRVEKVKGTLRAKKFLIAFGYYIHPNTEALAKKHSITTVASYQR